MPASVIDLCWWVTVMDLFVSCDGMEKNQINLNPLSISVHYMAGIPALYYLSPGLVLLENMDSEEVFMLVTPDR